MLSRSVNGDHGLWRFANALAVFPPWVFFAGCSNDRPIEMATPNGLARIETTHGKKKHENGVCHDDSAAPVRAQTIDELHSLQRKRSAPTTPIKDGAATAFAAALSEEERHRQQLQSIRC